MLIGRTAELARIDGALRGLDSGEGRVLGVCGEPGIGKTRLLSELRAKAAARGHTVLAGRSNELEHEVPYGALVEALDDFLSSLGPRRLEALGEHETALAGVFPSIPGTPAPLVERFRLHRALRALLEELAARTPLVLVLDDVHWADSASLEAVANLLRRPPGAPVLIALSYRTRQASATLTAAHEASVREGNAEMLVLETLDEEQTAALLADEPAARRQQIFRNSGGNPFYIEQLRRAAGGADPARGAAQAQAAEVPAQVLAAIDEELRQLPRRTRSMLEGAAVAGDPFEPELAAQAAGLDPDLALELLDELVARDLVRAETTPRRFRFRHPIVRRAVYDSIAPGRRLAAHGRAANALRALGVRAAAQAHHLVLSARTGDEPAIDALAAAAAEVAASAPASAARWLEAAVALLPSDQVERRLELLSSLAGAQAAAGSLADARETLIEITAGLPPRAGLAGSRAVAALASVELALGRHSGARRRLEHALDALGEPYSPDAVPLLVALAMDVSYQGDFERATRACERALEAAGGADPTLRALARSVLAAMLELQGPAGIEAANACATAAAADFDALSDEQLAAQLDLPYQLGLAETLLERFEEGARHLERGVAVALGCGNSQFLASTRAFLAYCHLYRGRVKDALTIVGEAVETSRLLRVPAVSAWSLSIAASAWSVVDGRQALQLGEEALGALGGIDDSMMADTTHGHFAAVCANVGEHERCIEHMQLAGAPGFERFGEPGRRCLWTEALVRSTLATGRLDEARQWAARGEEFASGLGLPVAQAAVWRARAEVLLAEGDGDAAAELSLRAAQTASQRGAQLEAGRSRIAAGRALAAVGEREHAIEELRLARARMADCGARRLTDEAARDLRVLGVSAPAPVARRAGDAGVTRLSNREREVATHVAAGQSNREIATALYLSPKTIEGHMHRIFEKLGVTSRAQVAATIARQETGRE